MIKNSIIKYITLNRIMVITVISQHYITNYNNSVFIIKLFEILAKCNIAIYFARNM